MALYVADTHALAWYLAGSTQLSPAARTLFDTAINGEHTILISAIVIAELVLIAEKKRVVLDMTRVVTALNDEPALHLTALSPAIALRIQSLTPLPDIHDRLIVATALEHGATVITRDEAITASNLVPTVW